MFGSKEEPYPGCVLISFWCDYDNKNFLGFQLIFQFCSFSLLSKFGIVVIQLKFDLLGMLTDPEKFVWRIVFFSTKFKMANESHVTLKSLNCFTDLFQESNLHLPWPYVDFFLV